MSVGANALFNFVGDVRDDLDGLAQVVAAPLALDDATIHHAGRHIGELAEVLIDETLVVAEVEVGFGAIFGDEDFAVLVRVHGARIHVEVGVDFLNGNFQTARFEKRPKARGRNAFSNGRHHAAGHKNVFGHTVGSSVGLKSQVLA